LPNCSPRSLIISSSTVILERTSIPLPVEKTVYFYSESEWAGDWTPIIAVEDQNNKIVYIKFYINSISKTTDTPVYFVSPNDLYIGQYQVDINMMESVAGSLL
jgi:hypothetical protein